MADQTERLKKLYALAIRGVGGEKEQAQKLLEKLMQKYGVSLAELDEEQIKDFDIEVHGEFERKLLRQVVYKITGDPYDARDLVYTKSQRPCRTKMRVRCTEAQKIEVEFLLDFYKNLWQREVDALFLAFIHKHEIFGQHIDGKCGTMSYEEFEKMRRMMDGLSDETPRPLIEGSKTQKRSKKGY
jgi:hypothetical protein